MLANGDSSSSTLVLDKSWETLWEDLMSLYTAEGKDFYFLGPIVTQSIPGTAEGISPFIVIDGQQRLTTLTLLLAVQTT
ncbi:GmrSD restriction endonuclease domain-containing protein [Coleofasciculus sp. C1-SOL-03]|uniref:GmrSD restriction endonuclease domain-containing protein n=1 Tax=Coleofasciculus sp. C1-SOL-03 TaxID=3069522 RepID=UPI004062F344